MKCEWWQALLPVNTQSSSKWMMSGPCGKWLIYIKAYCSSDWLSLTGPGRDRCFYWVLFTFVVQTHRSFPTLFCYRTFTNALLYVIHKHYMNLWKWPYLSARLSENVQKKVSYSPWGSIWTDLNKISKCCQFHLKVSALFVSCHYHHVFTVHTVLG